MIYQLPNGKIIQISIEQYLDLSDEDIQYLISVDYGNFAKSPWTGSALARKGKRDPSKKPEEIEHDKSIDYTEEEEDCHPQSAVSSDEYLEDDLSELPDTESD